MLLLPLFLVTVISVLPCVKGDENNVLVCYWYPDCGLEAEHLDPFLCTHIIYYTQSFRIASGGLLNQTDDLLLSVARMKRRNPDLNLLLGTQTDLFLRDDFNLNTLQDILRFYSFDGFDVAWEFIPDWSINELTVLNKLKELKGLFARYKQLLTLTIYGSIENVYNIKKHSDIASQVDLINFALFHFDDETPFAPIAPLDSNNHLNLRFAINYLLSHQVPKEKLVLAFPNFGRKGKGGEKGGATVPYNQICKHLEMNPRLKVRWDPISSTSYFVENNVITYFDNIKSRRKKLELIKLHGLKGAMVYPLEQEDFEGACSEGRFPFVKQMRQFLDTYPEEFDYYIVIKNDVLAAR